MAQNRIIKGLDNPVIMTFSFSGDFSVNGLNTFTSITLDIGTDTYSTTLTPDQLFIVSDNELRLSIGDTTTLDAGGYLPEIMGYSATYDDGYLLSGALNPNLGAIIILER